MLSKHSRRVKQKFCVDLHDELLINNYKAICEHHGFDKLFTSHELGQVLSALVRLHMRESGLESVQERHHRVLSKWSKSSREELDEMLKRATIVFKGR